MNPIISIIIPAFNASQFISSCINSILSQNFKRFEVIIINDGSTDDTGAICDRYASQDSRIRVFHQSNQGVSIARNVGLDNAVGDWIMFVDADDYLLPKAIETMYNVSVGYNSEILLSYAQVETGNILRDYKKYKVGIYETPIANVLHPALWSYLFRASLITKNNIRFWPSLAHSEDRLFIYQVASYARKLCVIDQYTYVYRIVSTSVTHSTYSIRAAEDHFIAARVLLDTVVPRSRNRKELKAVKKTIKSLKEMSYNGYASHYMSLSTYPSFRLLYYKYFDNEMDLLCGVIIAYIKYVFKNVRTLISINSPFGNTNH